MREIEFFGARMHPLTMRETIELIDQRVRDRIFTQHVVVNVAKLVHMRTDESLAGSVQACDIVNIDGMGVVWGARFLGLDVPERVSGVDLFDGLLALAASRGYAVFLLGARPDVVEEVSVRVQRRHAGLRVVGVHHGYFWEDEAGLVEKVRISGAQMLFVAITSPKKENFINQWRGQLGVDFVMGVGGTFDVVAGKVKRAPAWMQRFGLEWFFRVLQEPRRMWRRYLTTNAVFAMMLAREKCRQMLKIG